MLRWRLISAAILISAVVFLIWLDLFLGDDSRTGRPGLILLPCALLVGLMGCSELVSILQTRHSLYGTWSIYLGTALAIGFAFIPLLWRDYPADCSVGRIGWTLFGLAGGVGVVFVAQMIGYREDRDVTGGIAFGLLPVVYLGVMIGFWLPIRSVIDNQWGMVALISMVAIVKISDSAAYTVGKVIGRHKMSPKLSPGKTIEGLVGGLAGGCLGAMIVMYWIAPWLTGDTCGAKVWQVLLFGLAVSIAGVAGDLSVSLLKRSAHVKNSSRWLPGLGGIMDIIDSVLAAAPVVFAFWATGWFGPV